MVGTAMLMIGQTAHAQEAAPAAQAEQSSETTYEGVGEIVVTAQKKSERLQDVPIAVSAFSQESLTSSGVREVQDLRTQVPNLQFSRTTTNSTNISIRGIGSTLVNVSADGGVGVHQNNAPLAATRITDADIFDVERVEVLRGPQGTLYGRNATGGVLNFITRKPTDDFEGSIALEYGNYDAKKILGTLNIPITDGLGLRVAGIYHNRNGYSRNTFTGNDVDGRDLWSGRVTLGYETDNFKAYVLYEHFYEKDNRIRSAVTRCTPDPGPASVGGVAVNNPIARGLLSQGCLNASIYTDAARGAPNTFGTVYGTIGLATGTLSQNANAGIVQSANLREFTAPYDPTYKAKNDLYQFNMDWEFVPDLSVNFLASHGKDFFDARQDPLAVIPRQNVFNVTQFTPGGVFTDPQLGAGTAPAGLQGSFKDSKQTSFELRLQSSFAGPLNFNVGGIYYKLDAVQDFLFATNAFTARSLLLNLSGAGIYIDPLADPDLTGHNYLIARSPYELRSKALLGEVYWDATDTLSITGGLRYTDDKKQQTEYPSLLFATGRGFNNANTMNVGFKELTGKLNVSWKPDLAFTDQTLVYASYSKGYKGGGFNGAAGGTGIVAPTYKPEFVNAYEIGTKNTFAGGRVVLNLTGFYYDYQDYQIAKLVGVNTATENVDATIKGLELESIFEPTSGFRLNANLSLLDAKIKSGSSIDASNPTNGDPDWTVVKNGSGINCIANTQGVAGIIAGINAGQIPAAALLGLCNGSFAQAGVVVRQGNAMDLKGKSLPNAPKWTINLGAQYSFDLGSDWRATLRGDYYRQGRSFSQLYNSEYDRLKGYQNINLSVSFKSEALGVDVLAFVRNVTNEDSVATAIQTNQLFGLYNTLFLVDPRTYGLRVTKTF